MNSIINSSPTKYLMQFKKQTTPIRVDLQFFADGQKTEKATPKRRRDAREKVRFSKAGKFLLL